jgi:hypothetical protein
LFQHMLQMCKFCVFLAMNARGDMMFTNPYIQSHGSESLFYILLRELNLTCINFEYVANSNLS